MTQRLAPSQVAPMPTVPQLRARPILRRIKDALEAMLSGKARNLTQAAKAAGISREYLSRTLSARPDVVIGRKTVPRAFSELVPALQPRKCSSSYIRARNVLALKRAGMSSRLLA
jgi:hypothetical protein